jgi:hypothetical protein
VSEGGVRERTMIDVMDGLERAWLRTEGPIRPVAPVMMIFIVI